MFDNRMVAGDSHDPRASRVRGHRNRRHHVGRQQVRGQPVKFRCITREGIQAFLAESTASGRDLGEVLDRSGVLLTPERLRDIQAKMLDEVAEILATSTPSQFTAKGTQLDLLAGITRAIERMSQEVRKR